MKVILSGELMEIKGSSKWTPPAKGPGGTPLGIGDNPSMQTVTLVFKTRQQIPDLDAWHEAMVKIEIKGGPEFEGRLE